MRNLSIVLPALVLLVIGAAAYIIVVKITTPPTILVTAKPGSTVEQSSSSTQASSSADINTAVITPTSDMVKQWQQEADSGQADWRLDPTSAAKEMSTDYGFTTEDQFSASTSSQSQNTTVQAQHGGQTYLFTMYQPGQTGAKGIWAIKSITQQ
jgi:sensor domain CHASE-containing protein